MKSIHRCNTLFCERQRPFLDHLINNDHFDGPGKHLLAMLTSHGQCVTSQFKFQNCRRYQFDAARIYFLQNAENSFSLKSHPRLVQCIQWPLNAANIEVDAHNISIAG